MPLDVTNQGAATQGPWEIFAIKYAERHARTRRESFIMADDHDSPHPMDFFVWLIRSEGRLILVDTGFDDAEASRRDRIITRTPAAALQDMGIAPEAVDTVIVTHLHYDHAGTLGDFPNAIFHLQEAEMAFATGPCMCQGPLQHPFTADHVCDMVKRVYQGKVVFHSGDGQVAPGITVHCLGGHSRGLQAVRVETASGPFVLASDASHYYENFLLKKVFPIVVDMENVLTGYDRLITLSENNVSRIAPGHDPLVSSLFPQAGFGPDFVRRLDVGPSKSPREALGID